MHKCEEYKSTFMLKQSYHTPYIVSMIKTR